MGRRHGCWGTRTWVSWNAMISRCTNTESPRYRDWGGRGIKVCPRWLRFENFLADMGERPAGTSLDRIDNDKGYSLANCKWSTPSEQSRNRRTTKLTTDEALVIRGRYLGGESPTQIAKGYGVTKQAVIRIGKRLMYRDLEAT